jgi:tRNA threonylcarbamoyladenosine biosynthesis protein TsaE
MSSEFQIKTYSAEETKLAGRELGKNLQPGTIISIKGELGSGKTVFVQGLALGLGVPESIYVTSPSYTLINEYPGRCPLFHADFYRLDATSDFYDLGLEDILEENVVVAIEWPDRLPGHFQRHDIDVHIKITGDNEREISLDYM